LVLFLATKAEETKPSKVENANVAKKVKQKNEKLNRQDAKFSK
jgi:hypothetical protein